MTTITIPSWNHQGLLPPIFPGYPGNSSFRSPFQVSLLDMVLYFSTTPERRKILQGFLDFRSGLHRVGLTKGFQWVDGSFMENVELTQNRAPNDLDLVTFFELPLGETEQTLISKSPLVFNRKHIKQQYLIDSYFVGLGMGIPESQIIKHSIYWYSMWAHQRDSLSWKGFLQIDLAPFFDEESKKILLAENAKGATS